ERGRRPVGGGLGVAKARVPVHPAAEWLVLALAAAAEAVVLQRRALVPRDVGAVLVDQRYPAGDAVRPVLRDLDRGLARPIDLCARLDAVHRVAESARRTCAHGADDLVHTAAARGHERLGIGVEDAAQTIGAEAGVRAKAAVVEHGQLYAHVAVAPVANAVRILRAAEADVDMRPVAERLQLRLAATTERELRSRRQGNAEPVAD